LLIVLGLLLIAAYLLLSGSLPGEDDTRPSPLADVAAVTPDESTLVARAKTSTRTPLPVILTATPTTAGAEPTTEFMIDAFDFLAGASGETGLAEDDNRLFQQWFWYSVFDDGDFPTGNLYDGSQGTLTVIGRAYRAYLSGE